MVASTTVPLLPIFDASVAGADDAAGAAALRDACGRTIDHLRLSVTTACDLACIYCRPRRTGHGPDRRPLSHAQRVELVTFLHQRFGLAQVRITGGEPLLAKGVVGLIRSIREAVPRIQIAMTTNGRLLAGSAPALRAAGLDRLNVSLDSLDEAVHRRMTGGELGEVLRGLDAAAAAGFPPAKVNTVVLRGYNDQEICAVAEWGLRRGHEVRFLEAMPIGPAAAENRRNFVSARQMLEALGSRFTLQPLPGTPGATAKRYVASANHRRGVLGIIAPVTQPFCGSCRRIRVSADGRLFPCLLDSRWLDLTTAWALGRFDPNTADRVLRAGVDTKEPSGVGQLHGMVTLGG